MKKEGGRTGRRPCLLCRGSPAAGGEVGGEIP